MCWGVLLAVLVLGFGFTVGRATMLINVIDPESKKQDFCKRFD